jgi:diketogulonate reductase-like aldo/keto reductase
MLHSPLAIERDLMEVWRAMEAIVERGGARQLGISNRYALAQLDRLYRKAGVKPAVVQNRFHAKTGYDRDIRAFCRLHGMHYQSFWTLTANPGVLAHDALQSLAANYGRTPAQGFFRNLTQIDIIPLTGTSSQTHMRDDLAIFEFELTQSECDAVATLL